MAGLTRSRTSTWAGGPSIQAKRNRTLTSCGLALSRGERTIPATRSRSCRVVPVARLVGLHLGCDRRARSCELTLCDVPVSHRRATLSSLAALIDWLA